MNLETYLKQLEDKLISAKQMIDTSSAFEQTRISNLLLLELLKSNAETVKLLCELNKISKPETFPEFWHDKFPVQTSTEALRVDKYPLKKGVTIKGDASNGVGIVYVGRNSNITSSDGYPLAVNQTVTIEIDDLSKVYVIGSAAGLYIEYVAV